MPIKQVTDELKSRTGRKVHFLSGLLTCMVLLPVAAVAQGSIGGSVGKQDQTMSGGRQEELAKALSKLGFSLRLDTIVDGGTTLGSTRLAYEVAHILECAEQCSKESGCTAFYFANQASASTGKHRCVIAGGRPQPRSTKEYTSGTRF